MMVEGVIKYPKSSVYNFYLIIIIIIGIKVWMDWEKKIV